MPRSADGESRARRRRPKTKRSPAIDSHGNNAARERERSRGSRGQPANEVRGAAQSLSLLLVSIRVTCCRFCTYAAPLFLLSLFRFPRGNARARERERERERGAVLLSSLRSTSSSRNSATVRRGSTTFLPSSVSL